MPERSKGTERVANASGTWPDAARLRLHEEVAIAGDTEHLIAGLTGQEMGVRIEHNRIRIEKARAVIRERIARSDTEILERLRARFGQVVDSITPEEFLAEDGTEDPPR